MFFLPPIEIYGRIVCIELILISILPILLSWKQKDSLFIIIYLFLFFYSIVPIQYYFAGNDVSQWRTQCQTQDSVYKTALSIIIFYLFVICGQWGIFKPRKCLVLQEKLNINNNTCGFICCIAIAVVCIICGKSGESVLSAGSYADSLKNSNVSSLYGYGVIPILIGMQYANSVKKRNIILIISVFFVLKDFLYGGRIDSIQLCLGLYILYFRTRWSLKKTILIVFFAFSVISIWGIFRNSINSGIHSALINFINNIGNDGNNSEVYYSSMRIFYFIDNEILSLHLRVKALLYFITSIFMPYSMLPPIANLSSWYQNYANTGGGGLFSVFMVAMCGWIGMAIIAYFLGYSFRKFQFGYGSKFFKFWIILTIISVPRWYAYYPIAIFKFALYGAVFYVLMNFIFRANRKHLKS